MYDDSGLAVFKLKAGAKRVHPMAFRFQRRAAHELFFPTLHIHHNEEYPTAEFDHELDFHSNRPVRRNRQKQVQRCDWLRTARYDLIMDIERTHGIVDGERSVVMLKSVGEGENRDVVLAACPIE